MAVYKPERNGVESKYYVYEFICQGKRFQGSTGVSTKTAAKKSSGNARLNWSGRILACQRAKE